MQTNGSSALDEESIPQTDNITAEDVLSDEIFDQIFDQQNEIYREKLIKQLREKAKNLHVSMKSFEETVAVHRRSQKKKEREKRDQTHVLLSAGQNYPDWYTGNGNIDEDKFCEAMIQARPIQCINGVLYDRDCSILDENMIEHEICMRISPFITSNVALKVRGLVNVLKMKTYSPTIPPDPQHIYLLNGVLNVDGTFSPGPQPYISKLNVEYDVTSPEPENWIYFLNELLYPADILTLQEYLGYCLIPSTKAQKLLLLVGNGGEGKSRIAVVLNAIFKRSMVSDQLQSIEKNKFALPSLVNKLIFLDEDINEGALERTDILKKLVTAEIPLEIEDKHVKRHEALLYFKFLLFGNFTLRSLYDHSDGFFRRQIILKVKPVPKGRTENPYLAEKLIAEKASIFNWCFQGLQRLLANNYQFTISEQAKANLEEARHEDCNLVPFLADENFVITNDSDYSITCSDLILCYKNWCRINAETPLYRTSVIGYLRENSAKYGIKYSFHVEDGEGNRVRGFNGIRQKLKTHPDLL